MLTLLSTVRQNLKCFYIYLDIYLPLVELEFSNIDVAVVWRLGLSQSVAFRRLTTLVVVWQHRLLLVWYQTSVAVTSGSVETTTPHHSCTFTLFTTNLHLMWSPTLNWSKEQSLTAVLLIATMMDSKISPLVLCHIASNCYLPIEWVLLGTFCSSFHTTSTFVRMLTFTYSFQISRIGFSELHLQFFMTVPMVFMSCVCVFRSCTCAYRTCVL